MQDVHFVASVWNGTHECAWLFIAANKALMVSTLLSFFCLPFITTRAFVQRASAMSGILNQMYLHCMWWQCVV